MRDTEYKTAVQCNITLSMMLGLILKFISSLLRNGIIKKSTFIKFIKFIIKFKFNKQV